MVSKANCLTSVLNLLKSYILRTFFHTSEPKTYIGSLTYFITNFSYHFGKSFESAMTLRMESSDQQIYIYRVSIADAVLSTQLLCGFHIVRVPFYLAQIVSVLRYFSWVIKIMMSQWIDHQIWPWFLLNLPLSLCLYIFELLLWF